MSPMVTEMASPPGLLRSLAAIARDSSMPCTGMPRCDSGNPMRPVPMASSSARPLPASSASRLTAGSIASGWNMRSDRSS
jgi:hypothetical protein